ncbi:DUF3460 family protein [Massilia sp. H-1]|nr:DUF3460 family protein [Massilia sp. H-1]
MANPGACRWSEEEKEDPMSRPAERYRPFAGGYVSEADQFLGDLLRARPALEEERMRAWYSWWDRKVDFGELDRQRADAVPVKPYHYE